jgi:hypothetical protein
MGHVSPHMIFRNYRQIVTPEEADLSAGSGGECGADDAGVVILPSKRNSNLFRVRELPNDTLIQPDHVLSSASSSVPNTVEALFSRLKISQKPLCHSLSRSPFAKELSWPPIVG